MIEGGYWDAAPSGYMGCAPRGMEGVSRLDEAGLQGFQEVCPAFRIQWQPIVETTWHHEPAQRANATAVDTVLGTGNHYGVLPGGMGGQPRVLGIQIAFDATARGRIE